MKLTTTLEKRLKAIDDAISNIETTIQDDAPFMLIHPYNMLVDEYNAEYYQDGKNTPKKDVVKMEKIPFKALLKVISIMDENVTIFYNNMHCLEWMHLYFQNGDMLTREQKERAKEKDINDYPFLAKLYDGKNGRILREMISDLPEKGIFNKTFLQDLRKGTIKL